MPTIADLTPLAREVASWACVSDIELHAAPVMLDGVRWYDTRPMVDPREHSPECIDMGEKAITLALGFHLAERHPEHPHLLRVLHHPTKPEAQHAQH